MCRPSPQPSLDRVRQLLDYDPSTGVFTWKPRPHVHAGEAGCLTTKGYRQIMLDRVRHGAHRLAWYYVTGEWPEFEIDHKNNKPWDNRFDNLRPATRQENSGNRSRANNNTSGRTGVCWNKNCQRWQASIRVGGKLIYLGVFKHKQDAVTARRSAEIQHFGRFAKS